MREIRDHVFMNLIQRKILCAVFCDSAARIQWAAPIFKCMLAEQLKHLQRCKLIRVLRASSFHFGSTPIFANLKCNFRKLGQAPKKLPKTGIRANFGPDPAFNFGKSVPSFFIFFTQTKNMFWHLVLKIRHLNKSSDQKKTFFPNWQYKICKIIRLYN